MFGSILAMTICVILSGYFSATETAFSSLNKTRLRAMAENGSRKAKTALQLSENYDKLISTILIGNNIVNIAVASIGTLLFVDLMGEELGATMSTVVVTIVVLIFGEITPKSIAKDHPESFALFSAPIIKGMIWFFTPLNFLFTQWKKLVNKLFKSSGDNKMSQEELLILLDEVQQGGSIDENEGTMLKNVVEFGEMEAQDILTHRVDLIGVPMDATKTEVARMFDRTHFTRLPVYEGTMDQIVGIVNLKDFYVGGGITPKTLQEAMVEPLFIHQTVKIDDLLERFKKAKTHLAVVVDEYGGTLGIVTMEDILEELVGEIWDEHDVVEEPVQKLGENLFLVNGAMSLNDFCEYFDVESDSESLSVGGWVMDQMERIPREGESFRFANLEITVCELEDHRVESVQVTRTEDAE